MSQGKTERETFIAGLRRETRWLTPIMMATASIFAYAACLVEGPPLRRMGAAILAVACLLAVRVGLRLWRASDDVLLLEAAKQNTATFAMIAAGMVLFAVDLSTGAVATTVAILFVSVEAHQKRCEQATLLAGQI
jgi:hypothetical protein